MFRLVLQLFDTTKKFSLSDIQDFRRLSKSNNCLASQPLSPTIQHPPFSTTRHVHSILSTHRNALIYKRKFFLPMLGIRTTSRQIFSLMISKENSRDSNSATFQRLSTTIGRFFSPRQSRSAFCVRIKKTVSAYSTKHSHSPCLRSPRRSIQYVRWLRRCGRTTRPAKVRDGDETRFSAVDCRALQAPAPDASRHGFRTPTLSQRASPFLLVRVNDAGRARRLM